MKKRLGLEIEEIRDYLWAILDKIQTGEGGEDMEFPGYQLAEFPGLIKNKMEFPGVTRKK